MRRNLQRLVRIFILAARLFHSQLQIAFSSAESGRISGQADLHIFYPNVSVEVEARFGADNLERLVGSHFHRLFLASLSKSFPRCSRPLFFSGGGSIVRAVAHYSDPTSAFTLGAPCAP